MLLAAFKLHLDVTEPVFLEKGLAPNMANYSLTLFLDNVWQHSGDGCHLRYLSSALPPPWHYLSLSLPYLPSLCLPDL